MQFLFKTNTTEEIIPLIQDITVLKISSSKLGLLLINSNLFEVILVNLLVQKAGKLHIKTQLFLVLNSFFKTCCLTL